MIRVMLDTDQPRNLSDTGIRAPLLATYADLMTSPLLAALRKQWGRVVIIDRGLGDPMALASVIDVERGTHRPADAPGWYDRQKAHGVKFLTVYCNRSTLQAVTSAMGAHRSFYRWIATLDGTAHITGYQPGRAPAAVQCLGAAALGFHADLSVVLEDWWHPTTNPPTAWVPPIVNDLQHVVTALQAHQ